MTLTEAIIILKRMQESAVIGNSPDYEMFNKLDFVKNEIIQFQNRN